MNNRPTLTIKEYDRLRIASVRDLDRLLISEYDAVVLQTIEYKEKHIFVRKGNCIIAQQFVGVLKLQDFDIEILPKVSGCSSYTETRRILLDMLMAVSGIRNNNLAGSSTPERHGIQEILIGRFLSALEEYVGSGLLRGYQKVDRRSPVIKGKINFSRQTKNFNPVPTTFECRFSKYISDIPINRFFVLCLRQMLVMTGSSVNAGRIKSLLETFFDIKQMSMQEALERKISFNVINRSAKLPYDIGYLFLSGFYASLYAGKISISAIIFDMNDLFEEYVYHVIRKVYGNGVYYQYEGGSLLKDEQNRVYSKMRPDIVISTSDTEKKTVIDTKWKKPDGFSSSGDLYQMNGYSTCMADADIIYLLYPQSPEAEKICRNYTFVDNRNTARQLRIRCVDLQKCQNQNSLSGYIKGLFG